MSHPYGAALGWLTSFIDSEKKLPSTAAEFNLPRTVALLEALGNPQHAYPAVVVAGTKGKGSTCAMLESIARASGLKTGLFTSPHLHSYRERIQVNRELLTPQGLADLVAEAQRAVARVDPALGRLSMFEVLAGLATLHFARSGVELAILEIGLGGRYDAVNAVTPILSVITSISFDHMAILGSTLGAIAGEKAGIIKPNVPVLTTVQPSEAAAVITARAAEQHAPLFIATLGGLHEQASGELAEYPLEIIPAALSLQGEFQMANAQLATGAAMLLRELGLPITDDAIRAGLASTHWPGRFEVIEGPPRLVIDGAHNGDSARVLLQSLRRLPHQRLILVLGTSSDKDVTAIARELLPHASHVILTRSRHPRSLATADLRSLVEPFVPSGVEIMEYDDIPPALEHALAWANTDDLVCATGSLFVAAAAREYAGLPAPRDD